MWDEDRKVGLAEGEIGGGVDRDDAWHRTGGRNVDRADARVRQRRPDDDSLKRAFIDVVRETAMAAEQPVIFDARHSLSEPPCGHCFGRPSPLREEGESSAARTTARRIDA